MGIIPIIIICIIIIIIFFSFIFFFCFCIFYNNCCIIWIRFIIINVIVSIIYYFIIFIFGVFWNEYCMNEIITRSISPIFFWRFWLNFYKIIYFISDNIFRLWICLYIFIYIFIIYFIWSLCLNYLFLHYRIFFHF